MVTIGDVFSVVAAILAICVSGWAMLLTTTLLFPNRARAAQASIERRPWRAFFVGLLVLIVPGTFALGMMSHPSPPIKLAGILLSLTLLSLAAVGASGLSQLVGERMKPMDPSLSAYRAVAKGAAIVIAAGLLPFVGWWVFLPIVLAVSLGSGLGSLFTGHGPAAPEAAS
jgi:hypothetical protein